MRSSSWPSATNPDAGLLLGLRSAQTIGCTLSQLLQRGVLAGKDRAFFLTESPLAVGRAHHVADVMGIHRARQIVAV